MRDPARPTPAPPRPQPPHPTHHPLPGMPPRTQHPATPTHKITSLQPAFDLHRIGTYHHHGCLHDTKQRPSHPAKERGGPLRFHDMLTLSSHTIDQSSGVQPRDQRHGRCR
jgi:hypothetical protein